MAKSSHSGWTFISAGVGFYEAITTELVISQVCSGPDSEARGLGVACVNIWTASLDVWEIYGEGSDLGETTERGS